MGCVGNALVAVEMLASSDVIIQNPVLPSHALAEVNWLVEAFHRVRDEIGFTGKKLFGRWRLALRYRRLGKW